MKIIFIDGTGGYYPNRIKERPTGGILTSLSIIPKYLASKGHDVSLVSVYDKDEIVDGVKHIRKPLEKNIWDVVVMNRNMIDRQFTDFFKNSYKIWWLHDVVDHRYLEDDAYRFVNKIIALSNYQLESYSDFYGINKAKFSVIPNGVDKDVFYPGIGPRNKDLYVMASAPIKGMFPIEFTFNNMRRLNPKFELRAYVKDGLHEDVETMEADKKKREFLQNLGVNVVDPIPQAELATVFRSARALLMPNHYPECCSNLLLQAQACGLPVITTPIGSAPEFIQDGLTGILTRTFPHDWYWHWKCFAESVANLYFNDELFERISKNAPSYVCDWGVICKQWEHELNKTQAIPA